jgi:hypothetical protein
VTVVLALVVQISFAASRATDVVAPESLNKASERIAVKKAHGRGTLIDVHTGGDGQLTVIAVHGIAGQPSDLSPLIQKAIHAGHTVKAFAYDDKFLSLEDSSLDLAVTIEQWWNAHPTSNDERTPESPVLVATCRAKVSAREHFARTPNTGHAGGHPLNARKG